MTSISTIGTKLSRPGSAVIGVVGWRPPATVVGRTALGGAPGVAVRLLVVAVEQVPARSCCLRSAARCSSSSACAARAGDLATELFLTRP